MRHTFQPRLINGVFHDPGLFIAFPHKKRAMMFDLGDIHALPAKDILKLTSVFVSHTHMDHFTGFDRLLRLTLGRGVDIRLFGPAGFLSNLEGKLAGYTWNLVDNFDDGLTLHASEIDGNSIRTKTYRCSEGFASHAKAAKSEFSGLLDDHPSHRIRGIELDHGIPCLAYTLEERYHINIRKDALTAMGLHPGPWINAFKKAVYDEKDPATPVQAQSSTHPDTRMAFELGDLLAKIAILTPGRKITYVTDILGSRENTEKIIDFAADSDHLFIEAAFLHEDLDIAERKKHLTARQAGEIASRAGAKQLTVFHFSPRYTHNGHLLEQEAQRAFLKGPGSRP